MKRTKHLVYRDCIEPIEADEGVVEVLSTIDLQLSNPFDEGNDDGNEREVSEFVRYFLIPLTIMSGLSARQIGDSLKKQCPQMFVVDKDPTPDARHEKRESIPFATTNFENDDT